MSRVAVHLDETLLSEVREFLGTETAQDTIEAALREVARMARHRDFADAIAANEIDFSDGSEWAPGDE